jgi:hypothetical protein
MRKAATGFILLVLVAGGPAIYFWPSGGTRQLLLPVPPPPALSAQAVAASQPPLSSVFLPVSIPVAAIIDQLNQNVPVMFEGTEYDPIHLRHATLAPWGDGVLLTVDLDAERKPMYRTSGRLYLTARPRLDKRQQTLYLDGLDFAPETQDTLASLAAWILTPTILETLQHWATLEFSGYVDRARKIAEQAIEEFVADMPQAVELKAELENMSVSGLQVTRDGLQVNVVAEVQTEATLSRLSLRRPE